MAPGGEEHSALTAKLTIKVGTVVLDRGLGRVCTNEGGIVLSRDPDTVLAPDFAFTRQSRLQPLAKSFTELVPDLVVEIVSPNDRRREVLAKAVDWLEAGVQVVWVLWPDERRLNVFRSPSEMTVLEESDTLTCEDLLPGFALPLRELFE